MTARCLEGLRDDAAESTTTRIRVGRSLPGIERLEARFGREGFALHRHDTYAIGVTMSGIQSFRYRGAQRYCRPRQCHILHPDEPHDGSSATASGFGYRILYVDPSLVQQALGGRPLPFVADPVAAIPAAHARLLLRAWDIDDALDDVDHAELVVGIADALRTLSSNSQEPPRPLPLRALQRVRDAIMAEPARRYAAGCLEDVAGLDRWTLARDFRAAYGTSPRAFRTMRQLDRARHLITAGRSLAEAAVAAGFCDQSHMSRMFKRAYGLTPLRWASAVAARGAA
ncbi:MAG: AraC family transcriptional regulator [Alphaproteobacteria bacterium]|nr:AraC family transcriptional regulator [Alphaproteobacteria bacterium]